MVMSLWPHFFSLYNGDFIANSIVNKFVNESISETVVIISCHLAKLWQECSGVFSVSFSDLSHDVNRP